uniref:Toll/interleukin-1 receptor (TIR) domain-containing protein n=1 Tax=Tanacetum cinerariifolium TaxID=118510 RepID=A0A6L2NJM6_TANCI|nr:Toll/interleukin-1 receptor (TIR) domain-containing protein [Tanacetum cinerariifolium]
MASTSTSFIPKSFKYDVFLSFRGEDTRYNFVSHLYKALEQQGIQTYKDDEKIEKGETIDTQLFKSIEDSRFYIVVFSKNYASSSWCLDELVKIMECRKASEQTAYPVFYDVEPMEIRKQSGAVEKAFEKHENKEAAGKWRKALNEAGNLAGWESKKTTNGDESKLIEIIVDDIFQKICSGGSSVDGNLVGMETRIEALLSSIELDAPGVRMIGIWGMGGGGKTTLATTIFNQIYHLFEGSSFVDNVREVSKSSLSGLKELQKQILTDIFSDQNITVSSVSGGKNKMVQMMRRKKVLVVLDDIDCTDQLEALAGDPNWYKPGSRIIITTRDEQVLVAHRVGFIKNVTLLSHTEAIRLFNRYAFTKETQIQGHKELSRQVVEYAHGLPLTIKVLGSLLCGQNEPEWKDALERLKTIPLKETMKILELSYDALDADYKKIFLDVACLLKGWDKEDAITALESCGFHARNGLRVLEQRSLLNIDRGFLWMHDHLEEMGKNIVRRLNPNEPVKHSRLWIKEEIEEILANHSGTRATKCITMIAKKSSFEILMKGLANMKELRFLRMDSRFVWEDQVCNWNLPNALRFLKWDHYPFSSLPKTFQAKNLVGLQMRSGYLVQLWKDGEEKDFPKLRFLKFDGSDYLRTLDLSVAPNLETLILEECYDLEEVHFQVTPNLKDLRIHYADRLHMPAQCPELVNPKLNYSKLRTLHLGNTPNLEKLSLRNCTDMVELQIPAECPKLVDLELSNLKLTTLRLRITPNLETLSLDSRSDMFELQILSECPKLIPAECAKLVNLKLSNLKLTTLHLGITPNLKTVSLKNCRDMVELRIPAECPKLVNLKFSNLKLTTLHLGITPNLKAVSLKNCRDMVELQIPAECPKLVNLKLSNLKLTSLHLGITPKLETLSLEDCCNLVELHLPFQCLKLKNLSLNGSQLRNLHLGSTPDLETLSLAGCDSLAELHMPFGCPKLIFLSLSDTKLSILDLGLTPNLQTLDLKLCYDLVEISAPIGCLKKLVHLDLSGCRRFKSFVFNKIPINVTVGSLSELHLIAESIGTCPLHSDNDLPKLRFTCFYAESSVSPLGNLEKLLSFGLCACTNIESFSESIRSLRSLRKLKLEGCITEAPKDLNQLKCLEELVFRSTRIKHLPYNIFMLKHLKFLELRSCWLIEKLPEDLVKLECLEELYLTECIFLRDIPKSICEMKRLKYFHLPYCTLVEKLPEELGRLESLKELNIEGTGITRLPLSIFRLEVNNRCSIMLQVHFEKLRSSKGAKWKLLYVSGVSVTGKKLIHKKQENDFGKVLRMECEAGNRG